jgi:nucleoside 2-deoxyribosyltransferase
MNPGSGRETVYISGPLQAARDLIAARAFYEQLAEICRAAGCEPYLPHTQTDPQKHSEASPQAVFTRDMEAMGRCSVVLADIGAPSSGVGAELAFAYEHRQRVIGIWPATSRPSRFILGMLEAHPDAALLCFRDFDDLRDQLTKILRCVAASAASGVGSHMGLEFVHRRVV